MSKKQKLELTWIGKEKRPKLEPRILLEDPARSYHAKRRVTEGDLFDNRLIFGDNLLALLRRLRHHRRRRAQDGPALDHDRAGRALPHAYHPAPAKGY